MKLDKFIIIMFNFLIKRFRRKISLSRSGTYILSKEVFNYECCYCKSNLKELPYFNNNMYGYEIENIDLKYQEPQISEESFKLYGWVIECKYKNVAKSGWVTKSPHKVYGSKEIAMSSIIQIENNSGYYSKLLDMRIKPVYHIDNLVDNRRILINKILKK